MKPQDERRLSEYDMLREALANLSTIAQSESPSDLILGENDQLMLPGREEEGNIQYIGRKEDTSKKVEVMKNTFRFILEYIRRIYNKEKGEFRNKAILQGIQTIMVLVGEVANKLDRYTSLFKRAHGQSITELKEYKDLQDFYINKIVKPSQERLALGQIPKEIISRSFEQAFEGDEEEFIAKSLSDLDTVRDDTDYELFYLSREDGSRFFSSELVREMQTAVEGGLHAAETYFGDDPFLQIKNWEDKQLNTLSQQCLAAIKGPLEQFYHEALKHKDIEMVSLLHRALMALMLGSSPKNMIRYFSVKSCYQYFQDFQGFLRAAMRSQEYYKLLDRPPRKSQTFLKAAMDIIHLLCMVLYTHVPPRGEIVKGIDALVERGEELLKKEEPLKKPKDFLDRFENDYLAIERVLRHYPNGPLFKALDLLIDENETAFDPLELGNLPYALYDVYSGEQSFSCLNLPCPTVQKQINKAQIAEEFRGFLRAIGERKKHCLIVNIQDRTSWKEHARSLSLEELQRNVEFNEQLTVVTFTKDTDFYYQLAPYQSIDEAELFLQHFQEHLSTPQCGFYFPPRIYDSFVVHGLSDFLKQIHAFFFKASKQLSRRERLDFIEIAYTLLQLKLVELTGADMISLTSKDGIDTAPAASVQLFIFLKLTSLHPLSEEKLLEEMLLAPALMLRERLVDQERFKRMIHMLKHVEETLASLPKGAMQDKLDAFFQAVMNVSLANVKLIIPQHEAN